MSEEEVVEEKKEEKPQTNPNKYKFLHKLDFFKFLPVPKTNPVSSRRSIQGSIIMLTLFGSYFILSLFSFITNNTPMVNQYNDLLPIDNLTVPDIAFAFFQGDPPTSTIINSSIFSYQYQQITKFQDVSQPDSIQNIALQSCQPYWIIGNTLDLLCPIYPGNMSGALYSTPLYIYPRILVTYCENTTNNTCVSQQVIRDVASGGKILLYIRNVRADFNHVNGQYTNQVPYEVFDYYLIPGLFPRSEIYFQLQSFTVYPDYFNNFITQRRSFMSREVCNNWISNISMYYPYYAFEIDFRMQQYEVMTFLNYLTIFEMVSMWGAFWSVLFTAFAAYFLAYNSDNFYNENKDWDDFGARIGVSKAKHQINHNENVTGQSNTFVLDAQIESKKSL